MMTIIPEKTQKNKRSSDVPDDRADIYEIGIVITRVNASERCFHAAGVVHGASRQSAGYGHGPDERRYQIARSQREHFLSGVHGLALR